MILLIDNYDSFTHNLYQYFSEITGDKVQVIRNDQLTIARIRELAPSHIVISPGPGRPEDAGISIEVIKTFAGSTPILGVCLGHQAIGHAFGAKIVGARQIVHGKAEPISHDARGLFRSIPSPSVFTRYHSLAIDESTLPPELEVTARSADGEIMGVRHRELLIEGVQFHPESIASEMGKQLLRNFLKYRRTPFVANELLTKIMRGQHLDLSEAESFMEELTDGNLSDMQIAGFLTAFNTKGIAAEEIAGCAKVLQRKRVEVQSSKPCLDTCGTGGDGLGTFNISSMAGICAAAAGVRVAKHGNRAVSSLSGSAEFYKALGIEIELSAEQTTRLLEANDFAFLFAPVYHGAMKYAGPARRELKVKTIMNLLGPLANPAGAKYQVIGVYSEELMPAIAKAAVLLGVEAGMVVHGRDGEDELSVCTSSRIIEFDSTGITADYEIQPPDIGISPHSIEDLKGGDGAFNAELAKELINGRGRPAIRDAVCLNTAAALKVAGAVQSLADGYKLAREVLETGKAKAKLESTVQLSRELKAAG